MNCKEKVIALLNSQDLSKEQKEKLERIFPELKESEDERIKKCVKYAIDKLFLKEKIVCDVHKNDVLAWLEKQGQKPADKVEPKFKVGDWLQYRNAKPFFVEEITKQGYINGDSCLPFNWENEIHLWTIQDAKDGDVLCCESGWTCIFKTLVNDETFSSYCFMDNTKWFCETGCECHTLNKEFMKAYNGEIKPATKEQRDLLFQKMREAGYEWDAEKKEVRKIEQKSSWSEEDEKILEKAIWYIEKGGKLIFKKTDKLVSWLKSIKDRVQPHLKQEWSEEDERIYKSITYSFANNYPLTVQQQEFVKSLKERYTWKPSERQIQTLEFIVEYHAFANQDRRKDVVALLSDLKKLKG